MKIPRNLPAHEIEMLRKGQHTRPSDINPRYEEAKTLGYGWEGYVYLVRDRSSGRRLVLKIFHEPLASDGLRLYAERVEPNEYGLYPVTLFQESDRILALAYPFVKLYYVNHKICSLSSYTAKALLGQFCFMQWYLMSHHGVGMKDVRRGNYLLAPDGQFHYIDYGKSILSVTDPQALAEGFLGYGFANLLLDLYSIDLHREMPYSSTYSYDRPCIYNMCEALDVVAAKHRWVRDILSEVRSQNASIFLDPEFYRRLGMSLPRRVCLPRLIILTSTLIRNLGRVRRLVGTELCARRLTGDQNGNTSPITKEMRVAGNRRIVERFPETGYGREG